MQSVVLTPNATMEVRRFGGAAGRCYVDDDHVVSLENLRHGRFRLRGLSPGETTLHFENKSGKCHSGLFVHVRKRIELPVAFLSLVDSSGKAPNGHWSNRPRIVEEINEILLPQVGVEVVDMTTNPHSIASEVKIDMDLGRPINLAMVASNTAQVKIMKAMPKTYSPVMPKFLFTDRFNDSGTQGLQVMNHLFITDGIPSNRVGRVCAHELAHLLTASVRDEFDGAGHTAMPDHLLNETGDGRRLHRFSVSLAMYKIAESRSG